MKNIITAREAENEMNVARNVMGINGKAEKVIVGNLIENAKLSCMIGDKLQMVINPAYVHIPEWQRNIDKARAFAIGNSYNKYKWDVPKVLYYNGKLYVIDGQHRVYGAFKANKDRVVVEILDCSLQEAIDIFINQSKDRKKMAPADIYGAAIKAGKEEYVRFRDICHKHNVAVKGEDATCRVGTFTSISDGIKTNPNTIDAILGLLGRLQWNGYADTYNGKAYTAKFIRALKTMYSYYTGRETEMENILVKKCSGTEWFTENVMTLTQAQIFDLLTSIVRHEMESPLRVVKSERAV